MASPAWSQVLQDKVARRKRAWYRVDSEGGALTFAEALRGVWMGPTTKERHFTTPIALISFAKRVAPLDPYDDYRKKGGRGGGPPPGKGDRDKGKGKGKGKKGDKGTQHSQTPDGKPICYRFNDQNRKCKDKKCRFVHVCSI